MNNKHQYFWIFILLFMLSACWQNNKELNFIIENPTHIKIQQNITQDTSILSIIEPYKAELENKMNAVVNYSIQALPKNKAETETALGNLIADLCFFAGDTLLKELNEQRASGCILNFGGLRNSLPYGPITLGKIYELMPFDNQLVAIKLNSEGIKAMHNHLKKDAQPIAGFQLKKNDLIWLNHGPQSDGSAWIITSSYLASGGDNMSFFKYFGLEILNLKLLVRDAIIKNFENLALNETPIIAHIDGRFDL